MRDINASARCVLFTKWVGQAWEEVSTNEDLMINSCGISVAFDGFEDEQIHILGLANYHVEDSDEEEFADEYPFSYCDDELYTLASTDTTYYGYAFSSLSPHNMHKEVPLYP